jgi:hypothetical protein
VRIDATNGEDGLRIMERVHIALSGAARKSALIQPFADETRAESASRFHGDMKFVDL